MTDLSSGNIPTGTEEETPVGVQDDTESEWNHDRHDDLVWQDENNMEEDAEVQQISDSQNVSRRKSNRKRNSISRFSPVGKKKRRAKPYGSVRKPQTKAKSTVKKSISKYQDERPYDKLANGTPFCCDLCKSPYVCNRGLKKGTPAKRPKHAPSPRNKVDPKTGRLLRLCNACGLAFDRPLRPRTVRPLPPPEVKQKYLEDAKDFSKQLSEGLNDPEAVRLYCPTFKYKGCGCIQTYILSGGETNTTNMKAVQLLKLLKQAKELSELKWYPESEAKKPKRARNIGLGNGVKKSKAFEKFVMEKREYLKETLKFCELATQRVLFYSNNFIHKKLKSEESVSRAHRKIGKAALGLLPPLEGLEKMKCCIDNCVTIAQTHSHLLQEWRTRARKSQADARRVLGEMLTPSGGARTNCYKFISMVTGCSSSLIGSVNDQMRRTGGNREPPVHGLRKNYLANMGKKMTDSSLDRDKAYDVSGSANTTSVPQATMTSQEEASLTDTPVVCTSFQFESQRQQLLQLQRQLSEQQAQLQQQQQLVQQQLLQQSLLQQLAETGAQVIQTQPSPVSVHTGLTNGIQSVSVPTNQLSGGDSASHVPILQQFQPQYHSQSNPQQALVHTNIPQPSAYLPVQQQQAPQPTLPSAPVSTQNTAQQNVMFQTHSAPQQTVQILSNNISPQQFMNTGNTPQSTLLSGPVTPQQTVKVMIANIELPRQHRQTLHIIQPQQSTPHQQQPNSTHHHNLTQNMQQQSDQSLQQQHAQQQSQSLREQIYPQTDQSLQHQQEINHGLRRQHDLPDQSTQQTNPALQQQPVQSSVHSQRLPQSKTTGVQLKPRADHTYSQRPPRPEGTYFQDLSQPAKTPVGITIVPNISNSVSVPITSSSSNSGIPVYPSSTTQTGSPLQMLANFTADPFDQQQLPRQPGQSVVPSAFSLTSGNYLQSQQSSTLATPAQNLQTALQQILNIVNVGAVNGSNPTQPQTNKITSPVLNMNIPQSSLHNALSVTSPVNVATVDTDLNSSVFRQSNLETSCLADSDVNAVTSTMNDLHEDSPEPQESASGGISSSPLSTDMMQLLSESSD